MDSLFKRCLYFLSVLIFVSASGTSYAILIDRGGGLVYDDVLDVTWLQDASYAMTSGYDADGVMSWNTAVMWTSDLTFGGYDDWRLPTFDPNNPRPAILTSTNEIGSLWDQLAGDDGNRSADEVGPFINIPTSMPDGIGYQWFWTGLATDTGSAWRIDMGCACWDSRSQDNEYYVWAVRDGDVAAVPEPGAFALMGFGLIGLGLVRKKNK